MDDIRNAIDTVHQLETKYGLSTDGIVETEQSFEDFKVFIPLIGRFSAGKSALINNLLGWGMEVCRENIGVATAIPTEIFYGENQDIACICRPEKQFVSMEEYLDICQEISADNAECVKLEFNSNELLRQIPSIAIVDMPGLDSGYEVHDKAIRNYIKKSMAYVLVFPADELIIPESMEPILHDLNTYDMPMCAVITKGNRIAGVEEQRKQELRSALTKYFGDKPIKICITEKETERKEEFVEFLMDMEEKAGELGRKYYVKKMEPEFASVTNYLMGYLKNMELSLSELEEQKDRLQSDIEELDKKVGYELTDIENQIPSMVNDIAMDVQAALSQKMEDLVFDLLHDTDVTSDINEIVRTTLNTSYQKRVMENIRKHMDKISDAMSFGSVNCASMMKIDIDKVCGKEISGVERTAIDVAAIIIGGPLGGILAHIITGFINKINSEKRMEAEMKMRQQLSTNVFPTVDKEVRDKVEIDLKHIVLEIRQTVEKEVSIQLDSLQKSLDEVIQRKQIEDDDRQQRKLCIESDIRLLEEVKNGIK